MKLSVASILSTKLIFYITEENTCLISMENYDVRIFGIFKRFIFKIRVHRLIYIWDKIEESFLFLKLYLMKLSVASILSMDTKETVNGCLIS